MIASLLHQSDVAMSFWRNDGAIITSCVRWVRGENLAVCGYVHWCRCVVISSEYGQWWFIYISIKNSIKKSIIDRAYELPQVTCMLWVWRPLVYMEPRANNHGWPSTQPGTCTQSCPIVDTAVPTLFTQPCPGRTMSTAVCIYIARLCASCPVV